VTVLCVIPGASHLYATEIDDRPTRWCFIDRKHLPHTWHLYGDSPPLPYLTWDGLDGYAEQAVMDSCSYYDPQWSLRCPNGHAATYFPGCEPL
jgi:hypothetical protein